MRKEQEDQLLLQRRATEEQAAQDGEEEQDSMLKLMPCKGVVLPIGVNVGEAKSSLVLEALRGVLTLRREAFERLGEEDRRILPFAKQKEVHCIYVFPTTALAAARGNKSGLLANAADLQLPLQQRRATSQSGMMTKTKCFYDRTPPTHPHFHMFSL